MKWTRYSCLGLLLFVLLAIPACNRDTRKRIAVVPKGQAHLFWQSVHAGAVSAARETGVEVVWNGPPSETDFTGQLQIVDAMIAQRGGARQP
jgi:ribose transport system substrate-binding protein